MSTIVEFIPRGSKTTHKDDFPELLMTGKETWDIMGDVVTPELIQECLRACVGLHHYYSCQDKAKVAESILWRNGIPCKAVVGSLKVVSINLESEFGFWYNPPYEFHAWVELGSGNLLDIGLPGVIENGSQLCDEIGPFLVGRSPVILAGKPAEWMNYRAVEILP